jgi:xanthine dehydrogenase/oxidase
MKPYHPNSELIYPPSLAKRELKPLQLDNEYRQWLWPTKMDQLLEIMAAFPDAKMVEGSSEVQIKLTVCISFFQPTFVLITIPFS